MGSTTHISWTDKTFNIVWGCSKYDALCKNCYAERLDNRYNHNEVHWGKNALRKPMSEAYWKQLKSWNKSAEENATTYLVFCSSMADWAEKNKQLDAPRLRLFENIRNTPWLTYQLLSKRYNNIKNCLPTDWGIGYKNVWLGLSVGKQNLLEKYMPDFLKNEARVRFLSIEPLLEQMDISKWLATGKIHQVIIGGESGNKTGKHRFRECKLEWIESLVDQCRKYDVPVFVKQLGTHLKYKLNLKHKAGADITEFPEHLQIQEFPKNW